MTPHISTTLLRTQSDERLVRLAAGGHERAFEAIVERYRRPLTRFAQRFVGEARAEEVVQTAFLNAWNSLNAGTEVRDLKPWLYRIVNNGAINAMQRSEYSDAPLIEASDFRLGPEAAYEQSEELRLTVEGIGDLPDRQREALLAVAVDGRAHADVARDLGVSDAGVRQLVRRARVQLRTAATAITPLPIAVWIAKGGLSGGTAAAGGAAAGTTATAAGGTAIGGAALTGALKTGAVVIGAAVVATGGTEVARKVEKDSAPANTARVAAAGPRAEMLIPGANPEVVGSGQVRAVSAPDGTVKLVAETPGSPVPQDGHPEGPGQPRHVAGVFNPAMPAPVVPVGGRGDGGPTGSGPQQVAAVPNGGGSGRGTGSGGSGGSRPKGGGSTGGDLLGTSTPEKPGRSPSGSGRGGSEKPGTTPSNPTGGGSDRPGTAPSAPAAKPDRPEKPSNPTPTSGGNSGGSGKGNQNTASEGDSGDLHGTAGGRDKTGD